MFMDRMESNLINNNNNKEKISKWNECKRDGSIRVFVPIETTMLFINIFFQSIEFLYFRNFSTFDLNGFPIIKFAMTMETL